MVVRTVGYADAKSKIVIIDVTSHKSIGFRFSYQGASASGTKELLPRGPQVDRKCPVSFAVGKILDSK